MTDLAPDRAAPGTDRAAALFAGSPDAVVVFDERGRCVDANPAACALLGYDRGDLLGAAADGVAPLATLWAVVGTGPNGADGRWRAELELRRQDDTVVVVEAAVAAVPGPDGPLRAAFLRDVGERRSIGVAEQYRALVEQLPAIVAINAADATSRTLYVSPQVEAILGYTPAEYVAIGPAWIDHLHPEDQPAVRAAIARADTTGGPFRLEYRRYAKDGRLVWLRDEGVLIRDERGAPLHWQTVLVDITEQKRAEAVLRESDARFRALTEHGSDLVSIFAADGTRLYTSPSAERILGYRREELLGPAAPPVDHPDDIPRIRAFLAALAREPGTVDRIESRIVRPDGTVRWLEVVGHNRLAEPAVGGIVLTGRDVTERKQAEAALRASEARFRAAFAEAAIGMALVGLDGRFLQVNRALGEFLGYTAEELRARTFRDVTHPDDLAANLALSRRLQAREFAGYQLEKRYLRQDGAVVWGHLSTALVHGEDGGPAYLVSQIQDITRQKAAEAEQLATEARYRSLLEHAPDAVVVLDAAGVVRFATPGVERVLGYAAADFVGAPRFDLVHPEERPGVLRTFADVAARPGATATVEVRARHADGGWRWVEVTAQNRLADPAVGGIVVNLRDVTARRHAEAALAAERDLLDAILEHLPDAVYVKDADSRFVRLNRATAAQLGVADPAAALGRTDEDFFPPTVAREFLADERRVIATGEPLLNKPERQGEGEDARWVLASKVPLRARDGRVVGLVGVNRDVTGQRRAEAALQEHAARLAAVVAVQEEVAAARPDPATVMRLVAERACTLTGADGAGIGLADGEAVVYRVAVGTAAAMVGVRLPIVGSLSGRCLRGGEVVRVDDAATVAEADREAVRATGARSAVVAPLHHRGNIVGVLALLSARPGAFGERDADLLRLMAGLVGSSLAHAEAFAALREAKELAEEASRLKSAFLSTMSHELRTPLNAVMGYAHLLLDGLEGELPLGQRAAVGQIAAGAARLLRLVEDVLDLARIEAGRIELDPAAVDPAAAVAAVAAELTPQAEAKGLALRVAVPAELPAVRADPLRLHQILLNLVGNAVKFTDAGRVTVTARAAGEGVELVVADTGVGIPAAALPHVFDEFRQADDSTTRRHGGTGLGLAIVKRLVEAHGGTIRVESEPGRGSTFTVWLPAASEAIGDRR